MGDGEHDDSVDERRRECVRTATGVLIARYGLAGDEAESVLMDWSRVTGIGVFDLAERLMADARRGTPDEQGALDLLRQASHSCSPHRPTNGLGESIIGDPDPGLSERVLFATARVREVGISLADTADRIARTYDAVADGRERRGTRLGDPQVLRRAREIRERAAAERDEAAHLRRVFGSAPK